MAPKASPQPIQYTAIKREDLFSVDGEGKIVPNDAGISFLNLQFSQWVTTINALLGQGGPVKYPSGIDMQGAKVTGLAAPSHATDAVPYGDATNQFGPDAQAQQLDVGKPKALKGLTAAYGLAVKGSQDIAALQAAVALAAQVLGVGGTTALTNPIIQMGHTGAITTSLVVTFPLAFPNTVPIVVAVGDWGAATFRGISIEFGSITQSGFTVHSDGTGAGALWIAVGS